MSKFLRFSLGVALVGSVLGGCSSGMPTDYPFFQGREVGQVVFGLSSSGQSKITLTLAAQNPDGTIAALIGQEKVTHKLGSQNELYLVSLRPGFYVFKEVSWKQPGYPRPMSHMKCLDAATYQFEVTEGETHYIGNVHFITKTGDDGGLEHQGDSEALDVQAKINSNHKNLGAVIKAPLKEISFPRGRDVFGLNEVCGGYYQKSQTSMYNE